MASTITNRAKMTLIIPLNSGGSLYLAPGESSSSVEDYELANNEKVEKLLRDNLISQGEAPAADAQATSAINTSPAPDASSVGPGADAPGVEGHGGKGRNK